MRAIVIIALLIVSVSGYAQNLTAEVKKDYLAYSELVKAKDFDKMLEYTHPGLFEQFPKEQVKAGLEQVFNNPQIEIDLSTPELSEFSETKKIENKYYVKFKSAQVTKMKFGFIESQAAAEKEVSVNQIKQNLLAQFGEGSVTYDNQTGFFVISAITKMLAVSDDKKVWKYVDIGNAQLRPILEKFIPAELFN